MANAVSHKIANSVSHVNRPAVPFDVRGSTTGATGLLAGVIAAAEYVAMAPEPEAARAEAGLTVDLLLASLTR